MCMWLEKIFGKRNHGKYLGFALDIVDNILIFGHTEYALKKNNSHPPTVPKHLKATLDEQQLWGLLIH